MTERDLFLEALGLPEADRPARLDRACAGDPALRRRVEVLLAAHDGAGGLLDLPPDETAAVTGPPEPTSTLGEPETVDPAATVDVPPSGDPPPTGAYDPAGTVDATPVGDAAPTAHRPPTAPDASIGTRIGPYHLLQVIGEGGMGTVYLAEQERPVRRKVALKIIKAGMDTGQVVARFEAERQALALMDHPNIARVLDAGATDAGLPYFVMELVHGVPITQYCDDNRLTTRRRLELFVPVCRAIQHAHQKGIIHRDIKPTNVLVTSHDGRPVPKVIDFGVAKAVEQRLTERTLFTQFGALVGTLEYMSPEQAEMSDLGIDTRSDVYALGVLLYELLTGTTPLERSRLRRAGYAEILRRIREEEPPRPSTRLSDPAQPLPSISARRQTEPTRLARLVRGELDWIVMKALEKDRSRRYETALGFARDVERHLAGEAVEAIPPSRRYRLSKFAHRHRAGLATAVGFATLLVLGAVGSTWQAIRATAAEEQARLDAVRAIQAEERTRAQRDRAVEAEARAGRERDRAVEARARADSEGEKARRSAAESAAVLKFFQDRVLAAARPEGQNGGLGRDATIRQAVDAAEPTITGAFPDQPLVEASVRAVLAETYRYLGEQAAAIRQAERSAELRGIHLGPDHPDTLVSQGNLAGAYQAAGQLDRAIPILERTLEAKVRKLGPDHPGTLASRNNLATAYQAAGQADRAIPILERTLEAQARKLGPDHPNTLNFQNNLAIAYQAAGQNDRAITILERTLEAQVRKLGADHPNTLASRNNLAGAYQAAGQLDRAIPIFERTLEARARKLGPEHPDTLSSRNNLATAYHDAGQLDRAIPIYQRTLEAQVRKLGPDHPDTLSSRNNLALARRARQALPTAVVAEDAYRRTLDRLGADHPDTLAARRDWGGLLLDAGVLGPAGAQLRATLDDARRALGPDHRVTLATRRHLARLRFNRPDVDRALADFRDLLADDRRALGDRDVETVHARLDALELGISARQTGFVRDLCGGGWPWPVEGRVAAPLAWFGTTLVDRGDFAGAESVLRDCLAIREAAEPGLWTTSNARSLLGASLLGQGKRDEAGPPILAGYEGLLARQAEIPAEFRFRLAEAGERVAKLHDAAGRPGEAARWRARLAPGPDLPADVFARP